MPDASHSYDMPIGDAARWAVYEANVQSYRQISLSTQALLLAFGAILMDKVTLPFLVFVMAIALVVTWYVFLPAIFCRTAIVDYHKFSLQRHFDRYGRRREDPDAIDEQLREKDYAKFVNFSLRRRVYATLTAEKPETTGRFRTMRTTRFKIDVLVPFCISLMWPTQLIAVLLN